eukprot:6290587-Prymnesium_polylepis.1
MPSSLEGAGCTRGRAQVARAGRDLLTRRRFVRWDARAVAATILLRYTMLVWGNLEGGRRA